MYTTQSNRPQFGGVAFEAPHGSCTADFFLTARQSGPSSQGAKATFTCKQCSGSATAGATEDPHLSFDQVAMPLAVNLLVVQEHAVLGPRAHEVVVTGAGSEAAADGGARLLAELASLQKQTEKSDK